VFENAGGGLELKIGEKLSPKVGGKLRLILIPDLGG